MGHQGACVRVCGEHRVLYRATDIKHMAQGAWWQGGFQRMRCITSGLSVQRTSIRRENKCVNVLIDVVIYSVLLQITKAHVQ